MKNLFLEKKRIIIKTLHMLLWLGVFLLVTVTKWELHYWQVLVMVHICIIQSHQLIEDQLNISFKF